MNCNDPIVRRMVLDCLRYWVSEYHIDGFRFDLASILGRDRNGRPLLNPPLIEEVAFDAVLGKSKLIAEAWDAGGLYQVGTFPSYRRWTEWNGKYRDTIRRFLRGDMGQLWEMARRIEGSPDLYPERGPTASVNFVTCHDGFTLNDLFSYDQKHNESNGEENRDGANDNYSWNCGWEGPSDDRAINRLRRRLMKNAIAILMVSQGVPLLSMGDEIGHTKWGNNNTYCHDSELNWFDWRRVEDDDGWLRFVRRCIAFRHAHPALRRRTHFAHEDVVGSGYPDISWHGVRAWHPDWAHHARTFAFMLCGQHAKGGEALDDDIYVAMNMHWEGHLFELPQLPPGRIWRQFANTALPAPHDIREPGTEIPLQRQRELYVAPRTVVILVGR
jgi:glycogen operon protein